LDFGPNQNAGLISKNDLNQRIGICLSGVGRLRDSDIDVRYGSKADISACPRHVRFTPKSGHWNSVAKCPSLCQQRTLAAGSASLKATAKASTFKLADIPRFLVFKNPQAHRFQHDACRRSDKVVP
jgi:hypothetical protein